MATFSALDIMRMKPKTNMEAEFDAMMIPHWTNYLTPFDVENLRRIATSKKYAGNMNLKYRMIDNIMKSRGFARLGAGTNRIVYKFYEDPRFVCKVAVDSVGIKDNPAEYNNQWLLRPYCSRMFWVSPCGTVGFAERLLPITSAEEFKLVADCIFEVLVNRILGKYIIEDVGTKYYMNWAARTGFGVCLIDYPYLFELDGAKLICSNILPNGYSCGGEIDYDDGFNELVCLRCGKTYTASDLKKDSTHNKIIISKGGTNPMNVKIRKGGKILVQSNESNFITKPHPRRTPTNTPCKAAMKVSIRKGNEIITAVDNGMFVVNDKQELPAEDVNVNTFSIGEDEPTVEEAVTEPEVVEEVQREEVVEEGPEGSPVNDLHTEEAVDVEYVPEAVVDESKEEEEPVVVESSAPIKAKSNNNNTPNQPRRVHLTVNSKFITEDASDY